MIDFTDISTARLAFKQLYNQVSALVGWDLKGSKLSNVSAGTLDTDGVNLKQLNDALSTIQVGTVDPAGVFQTISNLRVSVSFLPGADNVVDIGSTSLRFKKLWVYLIDVVTSILPKTDNSADLGSSSLAWKNIYAKTGIFALNGTASLPAKLDASKKLISAGIDLSSATEVLNTLPENRGGTGTTTSGINGGLTLTLTPGTQGQSIGGQGSTSTTIQYKDWTGTNQSQTVVTSVTLQAIVITGVTLENSPITGGSLTTNNFTNGKRTT